MLITRGAEPAGKGSTVGEQVVRQLSGAPAAWLMGASIMGIFAAAPGMPWHVFLVLAGSMLGVGASRLRRDAREKAHVQASSKAPSLDAVPDDTDVRQIVPMRPIVVSLSLQAATSAAADAAPLAPQIGALERTIRRVRNELVLRYGVTVPVIEIDRIDRLEANAYELAIHEVVVACGRFHWDRTCLPVPPDAEADAREHAVAQSYPLIDGAMWFEPQVAAQAGIDVGRGLGAVDYFASLLRTVLHRHAGQFVGVQEAQLLFNWLQREMPAVAKELSQAVTLPRFAEVMKLLVGERVSLRNVREIAETLVAWAPREKEATALTERVRIALGAQICQEFAVGGVLCVWVLERELESWLSEGLQETPLGAVLAVGHDVVQRLVEQVRARCKANASAAAAVAPVLLTTQALRRPLRQVLVDEAFDVHVLSYSELVPTQRVKVLGQITQADGPPAAQEGRGDQGGR